VKAAPARIALGALLLGIAMPGLAAPAGDDVAAIRAARLRYNAAIIGRDAPAIRAVLQDDYIGIAGSDGAVIKGGAAMVGYFAAAFRNPAFISYVRCPQLVTIAEDGERAMERGNWVGRSKREGGEVRLGGEYLAVWVPTHEGWKLRSESFVTLTHDDGAAAP
jgi:ketosteroid isomerase-like protein